MKAHFRFENLTVRQEARALDQKAYRLTQKFLEHEKFAMTSQIRRASVSVSSNIAEGCGRNSDKDFAHFLEQSYGSVMEVASLLYLALDEAYVPGDDLGNVFADIEKLAKGIAALNRSLQVKSCKTPFSRTLALDSRPSTLD